MCRKSQKLHYIRGVMREQKHRRGRDGAQADPFMSEPSLLSTSEWAAKNAREMGAKDAMNVLNDAKSDDIDDTWETDTLNSDCSELLVDFPTTQRFQKFKDETVIPQKGFSSLSVRRISSSNLEKAITHRLIQAQHS